MKKFKHKLNFTDVEYTLLSVSDFRDELPPPGEKITIIDEKEKKYQANMHKEVARIDGLAEWYNNHTVEEDDLVIIEVDPKDNSKIKLYPD